MSETTESNIGATPAPWEVGTIDIDDHEQCLVVVSSVTQRIICSVSPVRLMEPVDHVNARLISAAPELLEQLQSLVAIIDSEGFHRSVTEEARAAINKALGITEPSPCSPQ